MSYTRRRVLRDAVSVSLATAAHSAFPLLSYGATRPPSFAPGVRIFFIGTWLFCQDPVKDQMGREQLLAITIDDGMGHNFPYGPWNGPSFDQGNGLSQNPTPSGPRHAYQVNVAGTSNPAPSVQKLFTTAYKTCNFTYASIPAGGFPPKLNAGDIRVISIPLPTTLYVGNFTSGAISSTDGANYPITGGTAATAHVFEYLGGTLTYQDATLGHISLPPGQDSKAHFHFHTVPNDCTCHGPKMFGDLINTVFPMEKRAINLIAPCDDSKPDPGSYLPTTVTDDELDILDVECPSTKTDQKNRGMAAKHGQKGKSHMFHRTTAACAGSGIGVLGA